MAKDDGIRWKEYLLAIAVKDQKTLGALRTHRGLMIAESDGQLWIKGIPFPGEIPWYLRQLPLTESYLLSSDGLLFPIGKVTPVGKLKQLTWQSIADFITIEFPVAAFPGLVEKQQLPVVLVPSTNEEEGNALLTDLKTWKDYVEKASEARLDRLKFAVSENGSVLVLGVPVSPIPGKQYRSRNTLLLPCGFDFNYPFISEIVEEELNPLKDSLLLFFQTGEWNKIPLELFQPVTRSGVRLTL